MQCYYSTVEIRQGKVVDISFERVEGFGFAPQIKFDSNGVARGVAMFEIDGDLAAVREKATAAFLDTYKTMISERAVTRGFKG